MKTLYTSKLYTNAIFKNYKELCNALDEPIKTGKSKQLQLKDWERYFSYEKDGNKFIITEIFDTPLEKIDKRTEGNRSKYVQPFMDYVMSTFNPKYLGEYYTISHWTTAILLLLNSEICNSVYEEEEQIIERCAKLGIEDIKLYRNYVSTVKSTTRSMILKTFGWLQKRNYIQYQEGYKFYYESDSHKRPVCVDSKIIGDYIDKIEREICEVISNDKFPDKDIRGKQLVYILQHSNNKETLQLYNEMCMQALNNENDICCIINDAITDRDDMNNYQTNDFVDGSKECRLLNYHKCYKITNIDTTYSKVDNKQEVINIIQTLATKHMIDINYTTRWGEIIYPYDNEVSLDEIRKINNILFKGAEKKVSVYELLDEILEEQGEDMFPECWDYAS